MRRDELKEGYAPQPKNILIVDGRHGPDYPHLYRLALCLELEAKGCNPILILENSTVEGNYLHSEGYRCALSELKSAMPEKKFECLLGLVERRKQNSEASSFQVVEEEGETYLVFPEVRQDLKKTQGAFLTKMDIKLQKKIEFVNPYMYFHNSTRMLEMSISKLACDRHLKEQGVTIPATARFPNISAPDQFLPYSLDVIARKLEEEGVELPYIIKSDLGYGSTSVYKAKTIEQAQTIINDIMRIYGEGCVVQHRIPSSPEAGNRSEHIRAVVCDDRVIVAVRNRGAPDNFPDTVTKGGADINPDFYAQREICTLTPEQEEVAIKAGRALNASWRGTQENYVCGVDMSATHPPVIFEINDSPGLDFYVVEGTDAIAQLAEIMNDNMEIQIATANRYIDIITQRDEITEEIRTERSRIKRIINDRGPQDLFSRIIIDGDWRKALEIERTIEEMNPYSPKAPNRGSGR